MRRLISLLALLGCASSAPRVVAQQVKSPIVGGGSNRAALIPSSPGQPPGPPPTPTPGRSPTAGPSTSADGWSPVRLTNGGCCPDPFWSADSREVRFLARPEPPPPERLWSSSGARMENAGQSPPTGAVFASPIPCDTSPGLNHPTHSPTSI